MARRLPFFCFASVYKHAATVHDEPSPAVCLENVGHAATVHDEPSPAYCLESAGHAATVHDEPSPAVCLENVGHAATVHDEPSPAVCLENVGHAATVHDEPSPAYCLESAGHAATVHGEPRLKLPARAALRTPGAPLSLLSYVLCLLYCRAVCLILRLRQQPVALHYLAQLRLLLPAHAA